MTLWFTGCTLGSPSRSRLALLQMVLRFSRTLSFLRFLYVGLPDRVHWLSRALVGVVSD